jgi:hypothetical protein
MFRVWTLGDVSLEIAKSRRNGQHGRKRRDMVSMVIEFHFAARENGIGALWKEKFFFFCFPPKQLCQLDIGDIPRHIDHYSLVTSTGIKVLCGKFLPFIAGRVAA